ncbi:MAG: hypothetical protein ACOC9W_03785 [Persicimonas sp.]
MDRLNQIFRGPISPRAALFVGIATCLLLASCAPPDLLETNGDVGLSEIDGGADADLEVEFGEVAAVVRQSCATGSSCHGASGITNFNVEGDTEATDEQVRAALEGVDSAAGIALVEPGDAEASAFYMRLTADGAQMMPPVGGRLDDEIIETVRLWIDEGAHYE